jgi:predicted PurR-regulated permease PerM
MWLLPLLALPMAGHTGRAARGALVVALSYAGGYLIYAFNYGHYLSPIFVALVWATAASVRSVRDRRSRRCAAALAVMLMMIGVVAGGQYLLSTARLDPASRRFKSWTDALPAGRKLIFVRYDATHSIHLDFVYNEPDLNTADVVLARDLGDQHNQILLRRWPDRAAYLYDTAAEPTFESAYSP